ncbi:MAG: DNA-directed RNA polymerase sigma-70 factor [Saprospiraceae bacterium]|nr:MAG: DNA-directed RNA polymerase sigma-70 factor [Saprospiraceae bacterium]
MNTINSFCELSTTDLIETYQKNTYPEVFSELYKRYYPKILTYNYSLLHNKNNAEDATSEVFIKVLENISSLQHPVTFPKWIFRIARNHCLNILHKSGTNRHLAIGENIGFDIVDNGQENLEEVRIKEEKLCVIQQLLETMDSNDREILEAKYIKQAQIVDLQERYHLSEPAMKMRLLRARKRLRNKYDDRQHILVPSFQSIA